MISNQMELVLETLLHPSIVYQQLKQNSKISRTVVILIISGWLSFMLSVLVMIPFSISLSQLAAIAIITGIFSISIIAVKTMWLHFFSELCNGDGKVKVLFVLLAYSTTPFHFFLPFTLIGKTISPFLVFVGWMILFSWSNMLSFKAVKQNYSLPATKSMIVSMSLDFSIILVLLISASLLILFFIISRIFSISNLALM